MEEMVQGEVFLAEDTRLGRKVAIKRLPESQADTPEARHQLLREARAAAHLNHPNIAAVYDVLEADDQPYIVMEYVAGETLATRVRRGRLPSSQVVEIGVQLADALGQAHDHGVIHRDLKPSNILMTTEGKVKILDFGLAKAPPSADSPMSVSGHVVGTPRYMSPEQMLGYRADPRSDIYSVGVVLFELLTGQWPFENRDARKLTFKAMREGAPPATELVPHVPARLSETLSRAMAWEPEQRYPSATDLKNDLTELAEHLKEQTIPTSLKRSARTLRRRLVWRRKPLWVAALVPAALAVVLLGRWLAPGGVSRDGPPVVAVLPLANVTGDPTLDSVGVGIAHTLIASLSAVPSVTMVSRSATLEYAGPSRSARKLTRALGATFVVDGSIQRSQDRWQVTVHLVRADDSVAWGATYESNAGDLFELQRRLARALTEALQLRLTAADRRRLDTPPTSNKDAFAAYLQGRESLERPDRADYLERAVQWFQTATEIDAAFALAHAGLAEAYWNQYRQKNEPRWADLARESAERASRVDPDHPVVRYSLAMIYNGTGRSDDAMEELRQALVLQPKYDDAHALLGVILAERGRLEEGAGELRQAIEIRPNFYGHFQSLGRAYLAAGRYDEAADAFRRVTELQPELPSGFQSLGLAYHQTGDLPNAVKSYEKAISLGPSPGAHSNLGTIYYSQGRFEEAARAYREAAKLRPNTPEIHRNLGDTYLKLGKRKEANAAYEQAVEITKKLLQVNPMNARALGMLAVYETKLNRPGDGLRHATEAAALAPADGDVLYRKAVVLALTGRPKEALDALAVALQNGYSARQAREDDDLTALRALPEFHSIVGGRE